MNQLCAWIGLLMGLLIIGIVAVVFINNVNEIYSFKENASYSSIAKIDGNIDVKINCTPDSILITDNSKLDCYVQSRGVSPNIKFKELYIDVEFFDISQENNDSLVTVCYASVDLSKSPEYSDPIKCTPTIEESLYDDYYQNYSDRKIINLGVGNYKFELANVNYNIIVNNTTIPKDCKSQYCNIKQFNKRLEVVSSNDEETLKAQKEGLRLTADSIVLTAFIIFLIEVLRIGIDEIRRNYKK